MLQKHTVEGLFQLVFVFLPKVPLSRFASLWLHARHRHDPSIDLGAEQGTYLRLVPIGRW